MRPDDLASDTASKWPVFIHALEAYEKLHSVIVDYLVDLDVTVPLKTWEDIDGAILLAMNNPSVDVVITGYEPERNPYFNMMEINEKGYAEIVKKSDRPIVRRQDAPTVYSLTPAAYVVKKSALYQYEHWSKAVCKIHPDTPGDAWDRVAGHTLPAPPFHSLRFASSFVPHSGLRDSGY